MSIIKYHLDNISYNCDDSFCGFKIDGWCFNENGTCLDITVKNCNNFLLSRTSRMDVREVYAECTAPEEIGFHIEIACVEKKPNAMLCLKCAETQEELDIDFCSGRQLITKQKHGRRSLSNMQNVIDSLRMRVSDNICYRIENLWLDSVNNTILLTGWAFDDTSSNIVRLLKPNGKLIRVSRQDVKDYYGERNIDAMCGFEIQIPVEEKSSQILLSIGNGSTKYILSFDYQSLYQEIKRKNFTNGDSTGRWAQKKEQIRNIWKYGETGAKLKSQEYSIFLEEANLNRAIYSYDEVTVPQKWIELQKKSPNITIIIPIKNSAIVFKELSNTLESIHKQSYASFCITYCGTESDLSTLPSTTFPSSQVICDEKSGKADYIWKAVMQCQTEYFTIIDQEDILSKHYLFLFSEAVNLHPKKTVYYADYDVCHDNKILFPIRRMNNWKLENDHKILTATLVDAAFAKNFREFTLFLHALRELKEDKIFHIEKICYHSNAVQNQWNEDISKIIAFYLPQFHETPENNQWWGKGFTEWVNVRRAYPMFEGHNQPRVPGDLGYYDLVEDKTIQGKQVKLAQQYDIAGFCFYYYWFAKKRLLEKPINQYVENHNLNLPFCICWANETWSRRWDGAEKEILMQQVHNEKTDKDFIYDVMPLFKDERYIRIDGKPLLLIYRIELFPRPARTIARWKKICQKEGIGDIHVALVQSFGMVDHRIYGADSSVEFPPHKIIGGTINDRVLSDEMKKEYTGNIYSYKEIVQNQMLIRRRNYQLWPGSMLSWDNTARRLKGANVFHEFSPELYRQWLIKNHTYTQLYNQEPYMFVNAWNEWAEGTYLEPDQTYGYTMLEISKEVVNYK